MPASVEVKYSGPFFVTGLVKAVIGRAADQAAYAVAGQALAEVSGIANVDFKHPTPYYETQINIFNAKPGVYIVNDRNIVYGPWLEGVSFRNQISRFKGYHLWRRGWARANELAGGIANRIVSRALEVLK